MGSKAAEQLSQKRPSFGQRLRQARMARGYSQVTLAEATDVSQGLISKIERGDQANSTHVLIFSTELRINPIWLQTGMGQMDDLDTRCFDTFLTECYLYVIHNSKQLNPSIRQITSMVESLYNAGKLDGTINEVVFTSLLKLIQATD